MSEVPYTPPPPPPPPVAPPPAAPPPAKPQFDFAKPFTYVFEDPDWLKKIAIGGLFYLAGFLIVGWFFIFGYMARTTRNIIAGHPRPLPEWEDLGAFFNEGLRLFGVALVMILPVIALAFAIFIPAGILSSVDNEGIAALGSGMAGCISCLIVPIVLVVSFFMPGCLLFAAVEQRFGAAFEFARIWAFIKLNIGNYLLAFIVYLIARTLAGFGVMLLCIGVIFTGFWAFLITSHAFAQVYRLATQKE
jgi:hypothetical protein